MAPAEGLHDGGLAGPATGSEDHDSAHGGTLCRAPVSARIPRLSRYPPGYRRDRYGGAMRAPLDPDIFDPVCPSTLTPIRFGDKWAGMIIRCLAPGPRRFSELRAPLRGITARTLTRSLRGLERDGLVCRAGSTGYALTPLGHSLLGPMDAACAWAREHWDELIDAREAGRAVEADR
jgi:DNA-binding HxlR family transcriptional regulator